MDSPSQKDAVRRVLPRGRNAASRAEVTSSQRSRLLEAMTELAAREGIAAVTISAIVARAGVSKPTFYEHFENKQECFNAVFDDAIRDAVRAVAEAVVADDTPEKRIVHGLKAFLGYAASDDARARIIMIEAANAGPDAVRRLTEAHQLLADFYVDSREQIRAMRPEFPSISGTRALAIVGAVNEVVCDALRRGPATGILQLEEELIEIVTLMAGA